MKNMITPLYVCRYEVGQVFESKECEECECLLRGQMSCVPKECPTCEDVSMHLNFIIDFLAKNWD